MPSTVTAASPANHVPAIVAPAPAAATPAKSPAAKAVAQPASATASAAGSVAQQRAALTRMLTTYTRYQSHGADAGILSKLGRQILAAAKALGQHVTLPHAPTSAAATPTARAMPANGKVDLTA